MKIIEEKYNWARTNWTTQTPNTIDIHHALCPTCTAQDVHRWHLDNGWKGIAYHYFIRKSGAIHRGRQEIHEGGGLMGAENKGKIDICLEGCYTDYISNGKDLTEKKVPQSQMTALLELVTDIKTRWNIVAIKKHADYPSAIKDGKDCPGKYFPWERFMAQLNDPIFRLREIYQDADQIAPWAQEAVLWAYDKGIMQGDGSSFNPKEPLTRQQAAVLLKGMVEWK